MESSKANVHKCEFRNILHAPTGCGKSVTGKSEKKASETTGGNGKEKKQMNSRRFGKIESIKMLDIPRRVDAYIPIFRLFLRFRFLHKPQHRAKPVAGY